MQNLNFLIYLYLVMERSRSFFRNYSDNKSCCELVFYHIWSVNFYQLKEGFVCLNLFLNLNKNLQISLSRRQLIIKCYNKKSGETIKVHYNEILLPFYLQI